MKVRMLTTNWIFILIRRISWHFYGHEAIMNTLVELLIIASLCFQVVRNDETIYLRMYARRKKRFLKILFCSLEMLAKSFPLLTIFTIKSVNKKLKEFFKVQKECKKHNLLKITLVALLIKTRHFRQFSATFGPFCTNGKICHLTMPTWFRRLIYGMSITHVPLHLSI